MAQCNYDILVQGQILWRLYTYKPMWAHPIGHPLTIPGVVQPEAQEAQTRMMITNGDEAQEPGMRHKIRPI